MGGERSLHCVAGFVEISDAMRGCLEYERPDEPEREEPHHNGLMDLRAAARQRCLVGRPPPIWGPTT